MRNIVDKALYLVIVKIYSLNWNPFNPKYGVKLAAQYALLVVLPYDSFYCSAYLEELGA